MSFLEETMEKACADGTLPGAVLMAANKDQSFTYTQTFGIRSLKTKQPMQPSTPMTIASCTKLVTSIAALQLLERGLITLSTDVAPILPELADLGVLMGFEEDGKPVVRERGNRITLRNLLTHTTGTPYETTSPLLLRYVSHQPPRRPGRTVPTRHSLPLTYEPNTSWSYGTSLDWTGLLIERLTHTSLEEYMQTHICAPLNISRNEMTFWPKSHPETWEKHADMSTRTPAISGTKGLKHGGLNIQGGASACFGGHGLSASMPAFFQILTSLLQDDGRLLKPETTKMMFEPQLNEREREGMRNVFRSKEQSGMFVGDFEGVEGLDWGIGGVLMGEGGTLCWSGMPNLFWFIDRRASLCGLFGAQILPPGDREVGKLITLFKRSMYEWIEDTNEKAKARL